VLSTISRFYCEHVRACASILSDKYIHKCYSLFRMKFRWRFSTNSKYHENLTCKKYHKKRNVPYKYRGRRDNGKLLPCHELYCRENYYIQRDLYIPYVMLNVKWMGFRRQVDGTRSNKILYSCFTDTTLTDRPINSVASPFETLLPLFGTYRWLTPSIHLLLVCRLFFVRLSVVSCLSSFIY